MSPVIVGNGADFSNDGTVNTEDLLMLTNMWLAEDVLLAGDINRDSLVDFIDFAELAGSWLCRE